MLLEVAKPFRKKNIHKLLSILPKLFMNQCNDGIEYLFINRFDKNYSQKQNMLAVLVLCKLTVFVQSDD